MPVRQPTQLKAMTEHTDGTRKILWASVATVVVFVAWAAYAPLDQVTRASGQVIASNRSQIIQSTEGGVLENLLVKEGAVVAKNELLAVLDRTRTEAAYLEARAKSVALMSQVARLRAEVYGKPPVFPNEVKDYPIFQQAQMELFRKRQAAIDEDLYSLEKTAVLVRRELALNEPLLKTGDISEVDVIRLQRQVADVEAQMTSRRNKYFQDAQADLAKAEEELASMRQVTAQRKDSLDHTELRAPLAGVVKNVRITTLGAVIKPSEEVMQIVPADDDLVIEVKVRPQDVAHMKPGLPVNVKIDAYDYTIYGSLSGTLTYLSPDTLNEDLKPNELPSFRAKVKTTGRRFSARPNEDIDIQPGMTATAEIITGSNTVLKYLTKPLIKTISEALTER
jgi:membrane fusion protein, adhesin transport system